MLLLSSSLRRPVLLGHSTGPASISAGQYSRFWVLLPAVAARNKSGAIAVLCWEMGSIHGSWAELGQALNIFQHPPHSGTGQAWFSSQPHSKVHHGEVGSPLLYLSSCLGRILWKSGLVAAFCQQDGMLQLQQGHAHGAHLIHHSGPETQLRNAQAFEIISHLIYAHREQILGWLLSFFSRYGFLFEDEKQESLPSGTGRDTQIKTHAHIIHHIGDLQSALCNTTSYCLNLHFSSLSQIPRGDLFSFSEKSQRTL